MKTIVVGVLTRVDAERELAPTNYNGTFLDYVCEVEGMKE